VIATGTDMGRYMLAHLGHGEIAGHRILAADTSLRQQSLQFTPHRDLPGVAYGFYERRRGGRRAIEHAGSYLGWFALMTLFPDENVGIFMAVNKSSSAPHYATLDVLLRELWGEPENVVPLTPRSDPTALKRFCGAYQPARYSRSTLEKFAIFDTQVEVGVDPEGYLTTKPRHGRAEQWVRIEPLLFRRNDTAELLAFHENEDGEITHLFRSETGLGFPMAYERLHWNDRLSVQLRYLYIAGSILLVSISFWPLALTVQWIVRRRRSEPTAMASGAKTAIGTALFVSALLLAFLIGLDGLLGNGRYRQQLVYGMTSEMTVLLWVPIVTTLLTILVVGFAVRAWRRCWWTMWGRTWYTIVAATILSFVPFFLNWRLLGFIY